MAPVLHTHTGTSLALGNQQDPIFIPGHLQTRLPRLSGPGPLFPLGEELFEGALEVLGEAHLVGRHIVRLFSAHG